MKKKLLTMAVIVAAFTTSCSKDENDHGNTFGTPGYIDITLVNNDVPSKAPSETEREDGTPAENRISVLEFYVYDDSGLFPDPEVGKEFDEDGEVTKMGNGYVKISGTALSLNQKIRVSAGENKKFLVVANANLGVIKDEETFDQLCERLSTGQFNSATSAAGPAQTIPAAGLEMSGTNTVSIKEGSSTNQVYITVSRLTSKITTPKISTTLVELQTDEQAKEIWGDETKVTKNSEITFEFKGFTVVNGSKKSNVRFSGNESGNYKFPVDKPWDTWTNKDRVASAFEDDGHYKNNYAGKDANGNWFFSGEKSIYVYENKPERVYVNSTPGYALKSVYAFIIEGEVTTEGEAPATRYWRVDLTKDDVYHMMRNCVYKVEINRVTTPGYGTPKEAEEKPGIVPDPDDTVADFVIKVAQWDINEYTTQM